VAPLLELHHVSVMRGERTALENLSLEIAEGEHVAILGPNGCGKSTLIKTITRECYPLEREGSWMRVLGRERWDIFELRRHLGIVTPDLLASSTSDATGRDVVLSGFFSSTRIFPHHHPDSSEVARAEAALRRLGIAHLADRALNQMSSGEAKRTLIARALVHEPHTLLFDEPATALDIRAQLELRDTLRDLARRGTAILLVTHQVSEIIPEMERVILLDAGKFRADGPTGEVLTEENLRALFAADVRLYRRDGFFHLY
jgi:iron complex transport system ATP-binding protein